MSGEVPASNGTCASLDASLMLEAALQQMDGIIAGTCSVQVLTTCYTFQLQVVAYTQLIIKYY